MKSMIQLPEGLTLKQFVIQIFNAYYSRDPEGLRKLLESLIEVKHEQDHV
jgi:hypothetical protein